MDYDAIAIGSGFGGAITACRLAEAGYRTLILERGRQWSHEEGHRNFFPRGLDDPERWLWSESEPERLNGWIDLRLFKNMAVAQGAGVGGGSLIYANVSVEAPPAAFEPFRGLPAWPQEITYSELKPHYEVVGKMLGVRPVPPGQWSERTRLMKEAADKAGHAERFRLMPLAVKFDPDLALEPRKRLTREDSVFSENEYGVRQGTCYHCGNCDIGCDVNARNTLDTNYIPRAVQHGAEVEPLRLVTHLEPVTGGYRVYFDRLERGRRMRGDSRTARIVILAAGSLGSTELLLRCRDVAGTLPKVSRRLGRNWSSNGDFLTPAYYLHRELPPGPSEGLPISAAIDFLDRSQHGQSFWVQDGGFPDLMAQYLEQASAKSWKTLGAWMLFDALRHVHQQHATSRNVMPWFGQAVDAGDGKLSLKRRWWLFGPRRLHLNWKVAKSQSALEALVEMHRKLTAVTGGVPHVPLSWSVWKDLITPHPLGGCGMAEGAERGVVNHAGEVFGYRNLYVADGAIFPRAIGVNPSRTIGALAERIAKIIIEEQR